MLAFLSGIGNHESSFKINDDWIILQELSPLEINIKICFVSTFSPIYSFLNAFGLKLYKMLLLLNLSVSDKQQISRYYFIDMYAHLEQVLNMGHCFVYYHISSALAVYTY